MCVGGGGGGIEGHTAVLGQIKDYLNLMWTFDCRSKCRTAGNILFCIWSFVFTAYDPKI